MTNPMDDSGDFPGCCDNIGNNSLEKLIGEFRSYFNEEVIRHAFEQAKGDLEEAERILEGLRHFSE